MLDPAAVAEEEEQEEEVVVESGSVVDVVAKGFVGGTPELRRYFEMVSKLNL